MNVQIMCLITLLLIFTNVMSFFIRKIFNLTTGGRLFCGIFGAIAKKNKNINIPKVKILGLYNITRGKDSCGYFYGDVLKKNADTEKLWDSFIEKNIIDLQHVDNKVFIGHCRQKSSGKVDEKSSHPFNIQDKLIIAHNGTLQNHLALCFKYKINHEDLSVDSEMLGRLIVERGFSILDEYRGYAALLMHKLDEPNTLYVYHGASKEWTTDKEVTEERPMFFMETPEAVYFSSIFSSLLAIRSDEKQKPSVLKFNKVFRIHEGVFDFENTFEVNRELNNVGTYNAKDYRHNNDDYAEIWQRQYGPAVQQGGTANCRIKEFQKGFQISREENWNEMKGDELIKIESFPKKVFTTEFTETDLESIFYWQNRYHLDKTVLCEGILHIDKKGYCHPNPQSNTITYYFFRGVRLKNKEAFDAVAKLVVDDNSFVCNSSVENFARQISVYAQYPVCNIENEGEDVEDNEKDLMWIDGRRVGDTSYTPQFSKRAYKIQAGKLMEIIPVDKSDKVLGTKIAESGRINYFVNNEVVEDEEKKKLRIVKGPTSEIINGNLVDSYTKYFNTVYTDPKDYFDLPSEVHLALQFYMADVLNIPIYESCTEDQQAEISYKCNTFVTEAINEKSSFSDCMEEEHSNFKHYIDLAIIWNQSAGIRKEIDKEISIDNALIKATEKNEIND